MLVPVLAAALLSQGRIVQSPTNGFSPAYEWFRAHRWDTTLKASIDGSIRIDESPFHRRTAVIHTRFRLVRSFVALSTANFAITHPYRRRTMFPAILSVLHTDASHFIAALLVGFYASGRFNTPRSVRSQTSRFQYFRSCVTYVLSCEGIWFVVVQWIGPDIKATNTGDETMRLVLPVMLSGSIGGVFCGG